ncbi:Galactarate dehydratase (L-threo-forming) [bioreactor metagenome]|uniref:Galactarate dehydratase (L-threo-forming) n=1 Tax=bioreactor metagenome TaxID=1076179 RepID=A0A645C6U7_9ZZZZ
MQKRAIMITAGDSVATVVTDVVQGDEVMVKSDAGEFKVISHHTIPFGHKIALRNVEKGGPVIKYGESIGKATKNIEIGDYVHVHNVESGRGRGDLEVKLA